MIYQNSVQLLLLAQTPFLQVMLLVEVGADAGAIDEDGNNSLHIATRYIYIHWFISVKCVHYKQMRHFEIHEDGNNFLHIR